MRSIYKLLLPLAFVCLAASSAIAAVDHRGTPREAKALLQEAVTLVKSEGEKEALSQFNDKKGHFTHGDLYIFAMDTEGNYLASGANPRLVGQNFFKQHAIAGREIDKDMMKVPTDGDRDIFEYEWLNRATNKLETKFSYVERVGEIVLGVGIYVPNK